MAERRSDMKCPICEGEGSHRESDYENRHRCYTCNGTGTWTREQVIAEIARLHKRIENEKSTIRKLELEILSLTSHI